MSNSFTSIHPAWNRCCALCAGALELSIDINCNKLRSNWICHAVEFRAKYNSFDWVESNNHLSFWWNGRANWSEWRRRWRRHKMKQTIEFSFCFREWVLRLSGWRLTNGFEWSPGLTGRICWFGTELRLMCHLGGIRRGPNWMVIGRVLSPERPPSTQIRIPTCTSTCASSSFASSDWQFFIRETTESFVYSLAVSFVVLSSIWFFFLSFVFLPSFCFVSRLFHF